MCLLLIAFQQHPKYSLIVAANRDESYHRPTAKAHVWSDKPIILAGRDMEKMGTWMGVNNTGRFAALTNYRDPKSLTDGKRSRGEIVTNALTYQGDLKSYIQYLDLTKDSYPGYNLVAGNGEELYYYSNIGQKPQSLGPGIYGVSNHQLNTNWPKVEKGKAGLNKLINNSTENLTEKLMDLLHDTEPASDDTLPSTGVTLEWERRLSPLFIQSENYGTRSSTVLLLSKTEIEYTERMFEKGKITDQKFTNSY